MPAQVWFLTTYLVPWAPLGVISALRSRSNPWAHICVCLHPITKLSQKFIVGQRDTAGVLTLVLHITIYDLIPRTSYWFLTITRNYYLVQGQKYVLCHPKIKLKNKFMLDFRNIGTFWSLCGRTTAYKFCGYTIQLLTNVISSYLGMQFCSKYYIQDEDTICPIVESKRVNLSSNIIRGTLH